MRWRHSSAVRPCKKRVLRAYVRAYIYADRREVKLMVTWDRAKLQGKAIVMKVGGMEEMR